MLTILSFVGIAGIAKMITVLYKLHTYVANKQNVMKFHLQL
jgi:hypothetical protein